MATAIVDEAILCQAAADDGGVVTWASVLLDADINDASLTCLPGTPANSIIPGIFDSAATGQTRLMVAIDGSSTSDLEVTGGGFSLNLTTALGAGGVTNTIGFQISTPGTIGALTTAINDLTVVCIVRN